jgi:DNA polymerase-3 subunit epsilon
MNRTSRRDFPAAELFERAQLVVLDCETTGLTAKARIVEIGLAVLDRNGVLISSWGSLLCGDRWIDDEVSRVNGITSEMLFTAPKFKKFSGELMKLFQTIPIVAHNAAFDHSRFSFEFARLRMPSPPNFICSMRLLKELSYGKLSLDRASEMFDLEVAPDHSAETDAIVTAKLLQAVASKHPEEWQLW